MANKLRGEFEVEFRGEVLTLRLGINQICELEERRDEGVLVLINSIASGKARIVDMRDLAWAMLRSADPECLITDAGELLEIIMGDTKLLEKMQDSMIAAVAGDDSGGAEGKPKARRKK